MMSGKTAKFSRRQIARGLRKGHKAQLIAAWKDALSAPLSERIRLAIWLVRGARKNKAIVIK
jgi:hypothetical protein